MRRRNVRRRADFTRIIMSPASGAKMRVSDKNKKMQGISVFSKQKSRTPRFQK
jgi:hypothetical protein